jgi:hypothetical protein
VVGTAERTRLHGGEEGGWETPEASGQPAVLPFFSPADLQALKGLLKEDGQGWRMISLIALFCLWAFALGTLFLLYVHYQGQPVL